MDERLARAVAGIPTLDKLSQFEKNAERLGKVDEELRSAIDARTVQLGRELVAEKAKISITDLSPAEEKIIQAVSAYVGIKRREGRNASRTFMQLRNRGLIEAAEASVAKTKPTGGYETLAAENLIDLSYEQIIVDHPEEFSDRALWYARRTLGEKNASDKPPAKGSSFVQSRTEELLLWLQSRAIENNGLIAPYTNSEAADAIGLNDMHRYGRVQGGIQSRLDFACYRAGLPPLGLTAVAKFGDAWGNPERRSWEYPVNAMQKAAQTRVWSGRDFARILESSRALPGQAHLSWKAEISGNEAAVKAWAFGEAYAPEDPSPLQAEPTPRNARNPNWTREEHILGLDLYLRLRGTSFDEATPEIIALSEALLRLAHIRGMSGNASFRNPVGVSMKMSNFSRIDPEHVADGRVGLPAGSELEEEVWKDFIDNRGALRQAVLEIMTEIENADANAAATADDPRDLPAPEPAAAQNPEDEPALSTGLAAALIELAALEAKFANAPPEEKVKESSRIERGPIGQAVKRATGHRCQLCEAMGAPAVSFLKKNGIPYVEAHHVMPVATRLTGILSSTNIMTLCANHHRQMHYGNVEVNVTETAFDVQIEHESWTVTKVNLMKSTDEPLHSDSARIATAGAIAVS
ncbi:HNH endonuclease [Rhizobium giardinii]|uniref:HNH endonuclease n=1 Tax=Rhizobium giardinii TaxID=56731 RepID=UPI003D6FDA47